MNWYLVQIITEQVDDLDAIDARKFRRLKAANSREAAIKPLCRPGAIQRLVAEEIKVVFSYVAKADGPTYPNGVPMFLERYELGIRDSETSPLEE